MYVSICEVGEPSLGEDTAATLYVIDSGSEERQKYYTSLIHCCFRHHGYPVRSIQLVVRVLFWPSTRSRRDLGERETPSTAMEQSCIPFEAIRAG